MFELGTLTHAEPQYPEVLAFVGRQYPTLQVPPLQEITTLLLAVWNGFQHPEIEPFLQAPVYLYPKQSIVVTCLLHSLCVSYAPDGHLEDVD